MTDVATALDGPPRVEGEKILVDAFGISGGPRLLDQALAGTGIFVFKDVHRTDMTLAALVHAVLEHLCKLGPATIERVVEALFVFLAGDAAARAWVEAYRPELLPRVPLADYEAARRLYERDRQAGQVGLVREGLEQIDASGARLLTPALKATLQQAQAGLDRLNLFKTAHDFLHDIQTQLLVQADGLVLGALPGDRTRLVLALVKGTEDAARKGGVLQAKAAAMNLVEEVQPFTAELVGLAGDLETRAAAEPDDAVADLRYELRFLVRSHLPRLHSLLARTADDIPFEALQDLLGQARAATVDKAADSTLADAEAALSALIPRLQETLARHGLWQQIDRELWALDDGLAVAGLPSGGAARHWKAVLKRLRSLEARDPACAALLATAHGLEAAAATGLADPVGTPAFIRAARLAFQETDKALLAQCEELVLLRPALANILDPS